MLQLLRPKGMLMSVCFPAAGTAKGSNPLHQVNVSHQKRKCCQASHSFFFTSASTWGKSRKVNSWNRFLVIVVTWMSFMGAQNFWPLESLSLCAASSVVWVTVFKSLFYIYVHFVLHFCSNWKCLNDMTRRKKPSALTTVKILLVDNHKTIIVVSSVFSLCIMRLTIKMFNYQSCCCISFQSQS